MNIKWKTWGGDKYEGQIIEDDGDCYIVRLADGTLKAVHHNQEVSHARNPEKAQKNRQAQYRHEYAVTSYWV